MFVLVLGSLPVDLLYTGVLNLIAFILIKKDKTVRDEGLEEEYDREDHEYELLRRKKAIEELENLYEKAVFKVGEDNAAIFQVHAMLLDDDDFNDSVANIISTQEANAEYAVASTGDNFSEIFANMDDDYFKARSADVKDIAERVIRVLQGVSDSKELGDEPVILVAEDLSPSQTVQMDKEKLLSFVTRLGSANSHTAILARTMAIPALVGVKFDGDYTGHMCIVDGYEGRMIIDPTEEDLEKYRVKKEEDDTNKGVKIPIRELDELD